MSDAKNGSPEEITQGGPAGGAAVGSGVLTSGGAPGDVPPGLEVEPQGRPIQDVGALFHHQTIRTRNTPVSFMAPHSSLQRS